VDLGQSPFLNILPDEKVRQTLQEMTRSPNEGVHLGCKNLAREGKCRSHSIRETRRRSRPLTISSGMRAFMARFPLRGTTDSQGLNGCPSAVLCCKVTVDIGSAAMAITMGIKAARSKICSVPQRLLREQQQRTFGAGVGSASSNDNGMYSTPPSAFSRFRPEFTFKTKAIPCGFEIASRSASRASPRNNRSKTRVIIACPDRKRPARAGCRRESSFPICFCATYEPKDAPLTLQMYPSLLRWFTRPP
jgi:hypothetical protein